MATPMIWIISPDPDTRRLIGLNLSKRELRTQEASSQDKLVISGTKPRLIILDMHSFEESGWEMVRTLRQSSGVQGVPLILLLPTAPTVSRLVHLQPVHWLEKPLDMDALLALVRESLGGWGA